MSSLTCEIIKKLSTEGWKCDDYPNLCPIKEHKGKVNKLVYDPSDPNVEVDCIGNSVIMRIGEIFSEIKEKKDGEKMIIPPGKFLFFTTKEAVNMPMDIDGTLFMNPVYSNMGLLFFTLGHVDPGFHGVLTGAVLNMTDKNIKVDRHADCLFLIFNRLEKSTKPYLEYHRTPQLTLSLARKNQGFNLEPGFALTKSDFITRKELYAWTGIMIGVFSVLITIIFNSV